jgi:hypothetical protein
MSEPFRIGKSIGPGEGGVVGLRSPGPQAARGSAMINHRTLKRRAGDHVTDGPKNSWLSAYVL